MKRKVEKIDVPYVANLARLHLSDEETDLFQKQLADIVKYIRELQMVDIDGVESTLHAVPIRNVFRPDKEHPGIGSDAVLSNAPLHDGQQFVVPKIV